jgi:hypothetical protein
MTLLQAARITNACSVECFEIGAAREAQEEE